MDSNKKKKIKTTLLILFAAIVVGGVLWLFNQTPAKGLSLEEAIENHCVLDYGVIECIDERLVIPFFNSGEKTITYVRIVLPVVNGEDIFHIREPLPPKQGESATLSECNRVKDEALTLFWCCEKCYESPMNNPNQDIRIRKEP